MHDMVYDGQVLEWNKTRYKATSGLPGHQLPANQREPDSGPIPEGHYKVFCNDIGMSGIADRNACALAPGWGVETIPRGPAAGSCEPYWANWGNHRARLEPVKGTKTFGRKGFYIHDSTKGFSHGCIEVQPSFFAALKSFVQTTRRTSLIVKVEYVPGRTTNGGTRV
ncbi:hypothetical protein AWB76_02048 [Caballeronia temeraria]|uniref:Tlde1 domain-containing protein n=1 Tax=Caballeronia temeraria TaxID=1777137 RepID=A0A158AA36_9BURK|nr:tlde1 domain-containing protein [Caballeronia temeraria]SAK54702.1 hypothetical protein AWB76_02048 [Caballeronia temeraria]